MLELSRLFENNKSWVAATTSKDPSFFHELSLQQSPEYLWIGCSDSRVPANQIVGLQPGEVFVHRNIANVVSHTDLNFLSVLQYAVEVLKVRHVIVTGHYGCGGVGAAMSSERHGLIDNWLRLIQEIYHKHEVDVMTQPAEHRANRLCELNVMEQVMNVAHTTVIQDAWAEGQLVTIHGWIYGLRDGLLRDLNVTVRNNDEVAAAVEKLSR